MQWAIGQLQIIEQEIIAVVLADKPVIRIETFEKEDSGKATRFYVLKR